MTDAPEFDFTPSAFRHGVSEEAILRAVMSPIVSKIEAERPVMFVIGIDGQGKALEVLYDIESRVVFHAMYRKATDARRRS
jgi:hypothetical protein